MGANLQEANLWLVDLQGAKLHEANLSGTDLTGANLRAAVDLSSEQLAGCESLCGTMLDAQLRSEIEVAAPALFERVDD